MRRRHRTAERTLPVIGGSAPPLRLSRPAGSKNQERRDRWKKFFRREEPEAYEFWKLATYNAERARGLVHYGSWIELMEREQERFNKGEPSRFWEESHAFEVPR